MTPEGKTKARIKRVLLTHGAWFFMPVPSGYGESTVDFLCARPDDGTLFLIEAKRHGKRPSERQESTLETAREHNIPTFVIDDQADNLIPKYQSCAELDAWLSKPQED